jgi:phenylacetic acid degradation operon negative regulatory protein
LVLVFLRYNARLRRMKPKTEEFLYTLLWAADHLLRPTVRHWTESYEGWAYGNGFLRQLHKLEKQQLLERTSEGSDRLYRLTEQGRLLALGGRDPQAQWARKWDGRWRLVVFDVPRQHSTRRDRLRRYLRARAFGCLQGSVWIAPDSLQEERVLLGDGEVQVKSLLLFEGAPCGGESDAQIVAGAWDFDEINRKYASYLQVLGQRPGGPLKTESAVRGFKRWAEAERTVWLEAVSLDPLLPERLLPEAYLGRRAWKQRTQALAEAGRLIRGFAL